MFDGKAEQLTVSKKNNYGCFTSKVSLEHGICWGKK
jgi:hypothetical protein